MGSPNVQTVRDAYTAWGRGDMDGAVEAAHEDIEVVQDPEFPGATSATGRAALRAWLASFPEIWEHFSIEPEEITEDGDRVVAIARISARGKTSGLEIDQRVAHVFTLRDGRVTRLETFADPARAISTR